MLRQSYTNSLPAAIAVLFLTCTGVVRGAGKCGTPLLFQQADIPSSLLRFGSSKKISEDWAARTYATDHFTLNYSLTGVHQVRIGSSDSSILDTYLNLYDSQADNLSKKQKQAAAYSEMDSQKAPPPVFRH